MKRLWRTLIVDDIALARQKLRRMLRVHDDIDVVAEAANSAEMLLKLAQTSPDLILLDITMPGQDGLSALSELPLLQRPLVIFITAHGHFAPMAFRLDAVDYLLKPVQPELLAEALTRMRRRARIDNSLEPGDSIDENLTVNGSMSRICLKTDQGLRVVAIQTIDHIEAIRNYIALHCGNEVLIVRQTMHSIADKLSAEQFVRVHRSTIINVKRVQKVRPGNNGEQILTLHNGKEIVASRSYRRLLLDKLPG